MCEVSKLTDLSNCLSIVHTIEQAQPIFRDPSRFPEMADPVLKREFLVTSLNQAVGVAAMCLQDEPTVRPLISDVVAALSFLAVAPPDALVPARLVPLLSSRVDTLSHNRDNPHHEDSDISVPEEQDSSESEDDEKKKDEGNKSQNKKNLKKQGSSSSSSSSSSIGSESDSQCFSLRHDNILEPDDYADGSNSDHKSSRHKFHEDVHVGSVRSKDYDSCSDDEEEEEKEEETMMMNSMRAVDGSDTVYSRHNGNVYS